MKEYYSLTHHCECLSSSHADFEELVLLHVEDAVEALPAVVAAERLLTGVLSNIMKTFGGKFES